MADASYAPEQWLCPVCGAVVDAANVLPPLPPVHLHYGRPVRLVPRPRPVSGSEEARPCC
jgi:hypothetical protein